MAGAMKPREYVMGRYRLRPGRDLLADGAPVSIGVKALDILATLVEAAGEMVTKEELLDRVWPGIVVAEHNIQVHISALRKALGPDGNWIVTVPRLGYRFVGPIATPQTARPEAPSGLPRPPTRLFGRDGDLAAIEALLERARLVTLVGPGGIGKTRAALELAHRLAPRYADGATLVDLSVLSDPSLVAVQLAAALGIEPKGDSSTAAALARRLRGRELLILFDNCEHVLDGVAPLVELILAQAPSVGLLATSREILACAGEQVYRLPLLPFAADDLRSATQALKSPAVALLVDRLQAADLHFALTDAMAAAAGTICRRLDGLPLAIEMAAALAGSLGLETVAERLDESLRLPYSGARSAPPRHRSLEAALDWSHALLPLGERVLLRRLAVFPARFSLEAVETVLADASLPRAECGAGLAGLVRKSLVAIDTASVPRSYRLLETIRSYALEKLDAAGEEALLRTNHARYVAAALEKGERDREGAADSAWRGRFGWLADDLRAALSWSFGPGGDASLGLVIFGRAHAFWSVLNLRAEGRRWAAVVVPLLTEEVPDEVAANVWMTAGSLAWGGQPPRPADALRRAAELYGRIDDPVRRGAALAALGQILALSGDAAAFGTLTEARELLGPSGSNRRLGDCALGFGIFHSVKGDLSAARREHELAARLYRAADSPYKAAAAIQNLADLAWTEGALDLAIETMQEAHELARQAGNLNFMGLTSGNLAGMLTARGDIEAAHQAVREAVPLCREAGVIDWLFPHLALRAAKAGRIENAARLWGYADQLAENGAFRQQNERQAIDALAALLSGALPTDRLEELKAAGRRLSEDEADAQALA
jgi:predicted ATPase/DNA-binding winged helix-turn-helix (wHTH) protein